MTNHKISRRTKAILWLMIGPTALFIATVALFVLALAIFPIPALDQGYLSHPEPQSTIITMIYLVGAVSVFAWLPAMIAGIILLRIERKKKYAKD